MAVSEAIFAKLVELGVGWVGHEFSKVDLVGPIDGTEIVRHIYEVSERCAYVRTLARRAPYSIDQIYVPLQLQRVSLAGGTIIDPGAPAIDEKPVTWIQHHPRSFVIDHAGMGKSTLGKKLLRELTRKGYLPFFFELRSVPDDVDFIDFVDKYAQTAGYSIDSIFVVFDGIDEIRHDIALETTRKVSQFITDTEFPCMITSRYAFDFTLGINRGESANDIHRKKDRIEEIAYFAIEPLDPKNIEALLRNLSDSREIEVLLRALQEPTNNHVLRYIERPLFAALLYRAYDFEGRIPPTPRSFYEAVFRALYSGHDQTKEPNGEFEHPKKTNLDFDQLFTVLRALASLIIENNFILEYTEAEIIGLLGQVRTDTTLEFDPENLLSDLLEAFPLLIREGNTVHWIHKSMMEYFAASYIHWDAGEEKHNLLELMISLHEQYRNILYLYADMDRDAYDRAAGIPKLLASYVSFATKIRTCIDDAHLADAVSSALFGHAKIERGVLIRTEERDVFESIMEIRRDLTFGSPLRTSTSVSTLPSNMRIVASHLTSLSSDVLLDYAQRPSTISTAQPQMNSRLAMKLELARKYVHAQKSKEKNKPVARLIRSVKKGRT